GEQKLAELAVADGRENLLTFGGIQQALAPKRTILREPAQRTFLQQALRQGEIECSLHAGGRIESGGRIPIVTVQPLRDVEGLQRRDLQRAASVAEGLKMVAIEVVGGSGGLALRLIEEHVADLGNGQAGGIFEAADIAGDE